MKTIFVLSALFLSSLALADEQPAPALPAPESTTAIPHSERIVSPPVQETSPALAQPMSQKDILKKQLQAEEEREAAAQSVLEREEVSHEAGRSSFGLSYVLDPFKDVDYNTGTGVTHEKTFGANINYIYYFLRGTPGLGRLGVGPNLGAYWLNQTTGKKHTYDTIGAVATYEAQFWIAQFLVPHISFGVDRVYRRDYIVGPGMSSVSGPALNYNDTYIGLGAAINLNRLEHKVASKALADTGVRKFYLAYTLQKRGKDGDSHFVGLRFEY